jgi:hypothetical protein
MKTWLTVIFVLAFAAMSNAQDYAGSFHLKNMPVSEVLDIYASLIDKKLLIEPAATNQVAFINLYNQNVVGKHGTAKLIETALREQANVVIVPLDEKTVSVKLVGSTSRIAYVVQANGSVTTLTNAPSSNRVSISMANGRGDGNIVSLTNGEPHGILLWNVRVQIKAKDRGTDGFGWDTVNDDYPTGKARYLPGSTGEFTVRHPDETPWRVCVLYSIDWTDKGEHAWGDYEAISKVFNE